MIPRILAKPPGPGMQRAYIESNLGFMREHRHYMVAIVEIRRNGLTADAAERFYGDANVDEFAGEPCQAARRGWRRWRMPTLCRVEKRGD